MPDDAAKATYENALTELEREASEVERHLVYLRQAITGLRLVARGGTQPPLPGISALHTQLSESLAASTVKANAAVDRLWSRFLVSPRRRGHTTALILNELRERPGQRSTDLANVLRAHVTSPAKNPHKLIITTVSYLRRAGRIKRAADGRLSLVEVTHKPPPGGDPVAE